MRTKEKLRKKDEREKKEQKLKEQIKGNSKNELINKSLLNLPRRIRCLIWNSALEFYVNIDINIG